MVKLTVQPEKRDRFPRMANRPTKTNCRIFTLYAAGIEIEFDLGDVECGAYDYLLSVSTLFHKAAEQFKADNPDDEEFRE